MALVDGLLNQTVTSISKSTTDGYGDRSYTVIYTDTPCRWQEMVTEVILATGEVVTYTVKMFLNSNINIKEEYRVIKDSKSYTVRKVDKKVDLEGNVDHLEVYLN